VLVPRACALPLRKDALHQRSSSVQPSREGGSHLGPVTLHTPRRFAPLGRDHAHRCEPFANVAMVLFAVELRVRQDQP
jgi:hypothetical protein